MKIEVVGSGGAFSDIGTSFLVDDHILVDCGDAVVKKLMRNKQIDAVETVLVTHKHFDHINGIEAFAAYKTYVQKAEFTVILPQDAYDLLMNSNICHKQQESFKCLYQGFRPYPHFSGTTYTAPIILSGYTLYALRSKHSDLEAYGYSIVRDDTDARAYFSGDVDDLAPITPAAFEFYHMVFHDVGWTGLPDCDTRVHPFEDRVAAAFGNPENLFGVHTDQELQHMKQAKTGDVFNIT